MKHKKTALTNIKKDSTYADKIARRQETGVPVSLPSCFFHGTRQKRKPRENKHPAILHRAA